MRFFVCLFVAACGAAAHEPVQTPSPRAEASPLAESVSGRRRPTALEDGAIARLVEAAERTRALTFHSPVRIEIESSERIAASLSAQITDEDVDKARYVYQALGLLASDVDVRALLEGVLGEQVVGYYDTDGERLVIRDDIMRLLIGRPSGQEAVMARLTLVHELVHALQDQRLGLGDAYEQGHETDDDAVLRCIAEGDAMLAMLMEASGGNTAVAAAALAQPVDLNRMGAGTPGSEALADAPAILRVTLVAPYILGLRLAAQRFQTGGWDGVNALYETPPTSIAEVLYGQVNEVEVPMPAFPSLAAYRLEEDDTLGALELSVYLAQASPLDVSPNAAGWVGDHLRVYRRGENDSEEVAIVWWIAFDSEESATRAYADAERAGGRVMREGRSLAVLRQVPESAHEELDAAFADFARSR